MRLVLRPSGKRADGAGPREAPERQQNDGDASLGCGPTGAKVAMVDLDESWRRRQKGRRRRVRRNVLGASRHQRPPSTQQCSGAEQRAKRPEREREERGWIRSSS